MDSIIQKINKFPKLPIIIGTCTIISIIMVLRWLIKRNKTFTSLIGIGKNAKKPVVINPKQLVKHSKNNGLNWTLGFWIYIDDLNYKFNKDKHILDWDNCKIWLSKDNHLYITLKNYNNKNSKIIYERIPIQKWLHIAIIYEDRYLDLWINGKLYTSIFLDNLQKFNTNSEMVICPKGGFSGHISKFKYYNYAITRKAVLNIDSVYMQYALTPFPILLKIPIIGHILRFILFLYNFAMDLPLIKPIINIITKIYRFFIDMLCNIYKVFRQVG